MQTLDRLLDPVGKSFGIKTAEAIAKLRADPDLQEKMERLACRCTEGVLTPDVFFDVFSIGTGGRRTLG